MPRKTAMVTGASSGIGAIYADRLAGRGFDLLTVARDRGRLEEQAARLAASHGVRVTPLPADLSGREGLEPVLTRLREDAEISMLVNCAGSGPKGPVLQSDATGLAAMVHLNVDVLHALTVEAAKAFAARGGGAIINIASVVALMPERFNATYVASKAFVLAFTQAMAEELKGQGTQIQAVLPGFTRTEIFERAGIDINVIPADMIMGAEEMVDAALAGFDRGELITIPSLADDGLWQALETARHALGPHLSLKHAAPRYGVSAEAL
ncbi:SDR family NAD(P)-dependent oxidoreductase [Shinella sp.]|uniref:SDR family NAD(P)-dependent oxidoreductase n=1 Tax=Shinella sp. TaxID=1870904 RepID=UPI003F70F1FB